MLPLALIVFVVLSSFVGKCGHPDTLFSEEARKFYLAGKDVLRSALQRMLLGQTVHEIANTIRVQSEETCPAFIAEHTSNFREPPGMLGTTSSATMNQIYGTVGRPLESPLVITIPSPPCQCHSSPMTLYQSKFLQYLPMVLVALLLLPCVAEIYRLLRSFLKPSPPARPSKDDNETLVNTRDGRPAIVSLQVFDISTASMNSRAFQLAFPEPINSPDRAVSLGPAIVAPPGVSMPAAPIPAIVVTDAVPTSSSSSSISTGTGSTNEAPDEPRPSSSTRSGIVRRHVEAYQALASSSSSSNFSSRTVTRTSYQRRASAGTTTTDDRDSFRSSSRSPGVPVYITPHSGQRRASAGTTTTDDRDSFRSSSRSPGVPVYITPHRRRCGEPALWRRSSAPDLCLRATATPRPVVDEEVGTVVPAAYASDGSGLLGAEDEAPVIGVFGDRTNVPGPSGLVAELTLQVRTIAVATAAVARGDVTQEITSIPVSGEMLNLVNTIDDMVQITIVVAPEDRARGWDGRETGRAGRGGERAGDLAEITYVSVLSASLHALRFALFALLVLRANFRPPFSIPPPGCP